MKGRTNTPMATGSIPHNTPYPNNLTGGLE
jgi:hypothetical protein